MWASSHVVLHQVVEHLDSTQSPFSDGKVFRWKHFKHLHQIHNRFDRAALWPWVFFKFGTKLPAAVMLCSFVSIWRKQKCCLQNYRFFHLLSPKALSDNAQKSSQSYCWHQSVPVTLIILWLKSTKSFVQVWEKELTLLRRNWCDSYRALSWKRLNTLGCYWRFTGSLFHRVSLAISIKMHPL